MRLFVAADIDQAARAAVAAEQERIRTALGPAAALRWVNADHGHLTLVFLGHVDETKAPALIESIGAPVDLAPFEMALEGVGAFPPRGAPRVLWIGVTNGAAALGVLQRTLAARVAAIGIALEDRAFHPHLTLARWKESHAVDRARALAAAPPGAIARMRVDGATLYHSRLSAAGPAYIPLARANLTAGQSS
jgi:2'-5' RNA ligase